MMFFRFTKNMRRWWNQEVNCCPYCGSVNVRWLTGSKKWRCYAECCERYFDAPLISNQENRPKIKELRQAQREKVAKHYEMIDSIFRNEKIVEYKPAIVKPFHGTGRNEPCPCGSGKKYKKCCGK